MTFTVKKMAVCRQRYLLHKALTDITELEQQAMKDSFPATLRAFQECKNKLGWALAALEEDQQARRKP